MSSRAGPTAWSLASLRIQAASSLSLSNAQRSATALFARGPNSAKAAPALRLTPPFLSRKAFTNAGTESWVLTGILPSMAVAPRMLTAWLDETKAEERRRQQVAAA